MRKLLILALVFTFLVQTRSRGDEGMWLLPLLEELNIGDMNEMGLKISAKDIYSTNHSSIKDAVVMFGNYCTGEIISAKGLLLTNHHCGYDAIQQVSSLDNNLIDKGYWALSPEQEIPVPGLTVKFLIRIENITEKIKKLTANTDPDHSELENILTDIEKDAVAGTHYEANAKSFFGGEYYYLFVYETFNDVRLVGAPPLAIGKFGGDKDNFEWPRHTGDFSLFRVYCGENGKPAAYDPENIPYIPKYHLPISIKGIEEGDFTMILGYPGETQSYLSSYGVEEIMNVTYPVLTSILEAKHDTWTKYMHSNQNTNLQYTSKYSQSMNDWKLYRGVMESLHRMDIPQKKSDLEQRFQYWIASNDSLKQKYHQVFHELKKTYEKKKELSKVDAYFNGCFMMGIEFIEPISHMLMLVNSESEKDDEIKGFKEDALLFYKNYHPSIDKEITKTLLNLYRQNVPEKYHPAIFELIEKKFKGDIDQYSDYLFEKSIFTDADRFRDYLSRPTKNTLFKDPSFHFMLSISHLYMQLENDISRYNEIIEENENLWVQGLRNMFPEKKFPPDANFTMRLNYGKIKGYVPRDAIKYNYFTTLQGVIEKENPVDTEFTVPEKLKKLYQQKDFGRYTPNDHMPVCFISNNHTTGGNSGSPVLNGEGQLIGILFDGNREGISGDIAYNEDLCVSINVDIRYVLFIIDKFGNAGYLMDEMTILP